MAQHYVTYRCGHSDWVNITGRKKDREWKLKNEADKPCFECRQKFKEDERQETYEEALKLKEEMHLPDMIGSPAQIKWAETIRYFLIKDRVSWIEFFAERNFELIDSQLEEVLNNIIFKKTSAAWWIENRNLKYETVEKEWGNLKKSKKENWIKNRS